MKACITLTLIAGALLLVAASAPAEPVRENVIWARSTDGAHITMDGVLNEPSWAAAETKVLRFGRGLDNGPPGSGYKFEGGVVPKDSTVATFKFLVDGDTLWIGAFIADSTVGGSRDFNRFDGLLMSLKDHSSLGNPKPPAEFLYSWWFEDTTKAATLDAPGASPTFGGRFATPPWGADRTPSQIAQWNAVTVLNGGGLSNDDSVIDHGYTIEMKIALDSLGYHCDAPGGDIIEFSVSVYDCDWYWPLVGGRFSANRTWWQCPWGNTMWYDEVRMYTDPTVTVSSGPVPSVGPEVRIPNGAAQAAPTIDGLLNESVWGLTSGIQIKFGDDAVRTGYGEPLRWRSGQYQPPVNATTADVFDPGDATVKWFFKDQFLYLGFDVNDGFVTDIDEVDRWDGFLVSINDKVLRWNDNNLTSRRLAFRVGPGGSLVTEDWTDSLITVLGGGALALQLKPNTSVDTLGLDFDEGYTAEFKIDLTKFHFPTDLGDGGLWIGIDYFDGDCFTPWYDASYGTRTWYGREYENQCCPASAYLDPNLAVGQTGVWDGQRSGDVQFRLIGNFPNPFEKSTTVRFSMAVPSKVTMEVFDLQGRLVSSRPLGLLQAGTRSATLDTRGLSTGIYVYRLLMADPANGALQAELSGKLMLMK